MRSARSVSWPGGSSRRPGHACSRAAAGRSTTATPIVATPARQMAKAPGQLCTGPKPREELPALTGTSFHHSGKDTSWTLLSGKVSARRPSSSPRIACHAILGLLLGLLALTLPLSSVHDVSFPLWWKLVPVSAGNSSLGFGPVHNWPGAFAICLAGVATIGVAVVLLPAAARLQAWPGRRLLPPGHA